ncbi:hypothetical protein EVAR_29235_1 [Eumeta japonica]|uniref:Uncharacterized protein n=1 Tax=Eumeta variegata TaxID=151549 RepID=A0A4C1VIF4_EUMVA|nr:hypothetical protein EVAR_29235_1 [Eumeta japonica]
MPTPSNLPLHYSSILWNQYSIIWIEIRSGEADRDRMRTGKRNRHRRPDSPDPNPKSKRDDISINQLT